MKCPVCAYMWFENTRSNEQNRAYFKLIVETLAKECNTTKDAMHKALAGEFLGVEIVDMPNGHVISVPKSTTNLSTVEFKSYVEKIQRYAAENGIDLPDPEKV